MQKKENQQLEIPEGIQKRMAEDPELKAFISELLGEHAAQREKIELLEKKIRELQKNYRMLERAVDKLLDTKWRDKPRYIQIRPAPKEARKAKTIEAKRANHKGVARPVPKEIDAVVRVSAERCSLGHRLRGPMWFEERYVEDIVPARVVRRKYLVGVYWDPVCKRKVRAKPKDVLPHERFGINLMLLVSYMRTLGITTQKIRSLLREQYGLKLSRSTVLHVENSVAREFGKHHERLREEIRAGRGVHFDETSWPVGGVNHWLWGFVSRGAAWYAVRSTRSGLVAKETLGEDYGGVASSDFYPSFDNLPFRQQKCLVHLLRDVRKARLKRGEKVSLQFRRFERRLRRIVQDAVRVHEGIKDKGVRLRRKALLEKRVHILSSRRYVDGDCKRVCKLLRKHWRNLFTFLEVEDVHWNNNEVERALRPSVVVRKNSYGSRSDTGARNHAILMTVSETCRMRGMNFMDFGRSYLQAELDNGGLPER